jgi:CheY-like chemotaxis protein
MLHYSLNKDAVAIPVIDGARSMKKILVVDDEEIARASLAFALRAGLSGCIVLPAGSGWEALEVLASETVDLVITDLRMPEMDGLELILFLRRNFPGLPAIVVSGRTNATEEAIKVGSLDCFTKPFNMDALCRRVGELLAETVKGRVENINLASFLQLLEIERKTCALKIESAGRTGKLFFRGGRLIDAATDGLGSEEAALEIVTWEDADIEIANLAPGFAATIEAQLCSLLVEAVLRKDEMAGEAPAGRLDFAPALVRAAALDGAVAALVAAEGDGALLGAARGLAGTAVAAMAREGADLLKRERRVAESLGDGDAPEEILVTGGERYVILRPLALAGRPFLLVALDRAAANLAVARPRLAAIAEELAAGA